MSLYGGFKKGERAWPATDFGDEEGLTVQADRDEADINKIIARFEKGGVVPPVLGNEPFYGDVSEFGDLADSLIKIQEAERLFMSYPAQVRERFSNNMVEFVDFLADDRNREEAEKLGLVQKVPAPVSPDNVVSPPPPPKAGAGGDAGKGGAV